MYAVTWMSVALDELADAFVLADQPRRDSIEKAVLKLNMQLAADAIDLGESREGNQRVAFVRPCVIYFRVDDPKVRKVRVTHFRTY